MKLQWRQKANLSEGLMDWIDRALEPAVEDRFQSTAEALEALEIVRSAGKMTSHPRRRQLPASRESAAKKSPAKVQTIAPSSGGSMRVYKGSSVELRELGDRLLLSVERKSWWEIILSYIAAAVFLFVMGQSGDIPMKIVYGLIAGGGGLAAIVALYLKANPLEPRVIEFIPARQLSIVKKGVIQATIPWSARPTAEVKSAGRSSYQLRVEWSGGKHRKIVEGGYSELTDVASMLNGFLYERAVAERKRLTAARETS